MYSSKKSPYIPNKGSIKWIILIVIGLVIASYFFNFNLQEAIEDEQTQANFTYAKEQLLAFYNLYLRNITEQVWDFFVEHIWSAFIENMQNMQNGEPTVLDKAAENLSIRIEE